MSTVKVRALIGKEWDPVSWDRDVWEDPNEAGSPYIQVGLPKSSGNGLFTHSGLSTTTTLFASRIITRLLKVRYKV